MCRRSGASGRLAAGAGPDAHDLEVDLLEACARSRDLDDLAAGRTRARTRAGAIAAGSADARRSRRSFGLDRRSRRAPRRAVAASAASGCAAERHLDAAGLRAAAQPRGRIDAEQTRRGRTRRDRTADRPRRGCGSRGRSFGPGAEATSIASRTIEGGLGIERGRRLVEEDHRRVVEQRARDGELLLHALAERARPRRRAVPTGSNRPQVAARSAPRASLRRGRRAARRSPGWRSRTACS